MIPNPKYYEDKDLHVRCRKCKYIGFELWQVTAGTIFDDIIVTDSYDDAVVYAEKTFFKKSPRERKMYEEMMKAEKAVRTMTQAQQADVPIPIASSDGERREEMATDANVPISPSASDGSTTGGRFDQQMNKKLVSAEVDEL